MLSDEEVSEGVKLLSQKIELTCLAISCFGGAIIGYDISTSGRLTSLMVPLDGVSLRAAFTSSLYVAALLSYLHILVRKTTTKIHPMLLGWIIMIAGILTTSLAQHLWMLMAGRVIFGIGVGFSVQSTQAYAARHPSLSYPMIKRVLPYSIACGMYMAHRGLLRQGPWRMSLGIVCVYPAAVIVYLLFIVGLPNASEEALAEEEDESPEIEAAASVATGLATTCPNIIKSDHLVAVLALLLLMQNLTGGNRVLMFYGPVFFQTIVAGCNSSFVFSVVAMELGFRLLTYWLSSL